MVRFEFATATRIVFGAGTLKEIGSLARGFGQHPLVVTGRAPRWREILSGLLKREPGIFSGTTFSVPGEPTLTTVGQGVNVAKLAGCDSVIAIGGGSTIDAGKAIAAMLTNAGELLDYVEVVGRGRTLTHPPAPFVAISTTAGTGAEVTRNAVLSVPEQRVKVSLRSPLMLPRLAVVDPELTYDLPTALTASTGLDALTQLIEPYVSCRANPMMDAICLEGIQRVARSLRRAWLAGHDKAAREDMALASLFGGLALANAGLGAVHGFAAPIGGMFPAAHGAVCAALLPHVMAANIRALRDRALDDTAVRRYGEMGRLLTGRPAAGADDGVQWVGELVAELGIPRLAAYGIATRHINELVAMASNASSMKGNPIVLTTEELIEVLHAAI
ncbi:MAG: iron-containing alcohol dehydrogenase [Verrucomicrobia subdivision 3 bacterium]|nr:iron-containing alcohol dehydrogenase [Limisphaerales bacterium]